ncbi:MAG: DUF4492 domain-containing protein, partial [Prolixibacteraceae bacterium]|nr:DUF4492 domain-containing protein [Prolixibacteraceae bacterium]
FPMALSSIFCILYSIKSERQMNTFKKVLNFYVDGFKSMTWGKQLWLLIFLKLFLFFFIMKFFFFSDTIEDKYETDEEVGMHILDNITNTK